MLLLAQAAWQRSARPRTIQLEGRRALATPAVCGLIGIGVLAYGHFHRLNLFAVVLAVGTLLAVIVRTAMTFEENQRITRRVSRQAVTDALTGLGNRRSLLADLGEALSASPAVFSILIIFDLDGFKRYNDSFGHPAGDALLVRLGGKLAASVTGGGRSYRLGGDEFCVLAPVPNEGVQPLLDATPWSASGS
jgi:two-component system, cell cycle response regulator